MSRLLLTLVTITLMGSCVTYNKCLDKFGTLQDSTRITAKAPIDTNLRAPVPADSLTGSIDLDSLCFYWAAVNDSLLIVNDSLNTQSVSGKLSTQHWIDQYNRLLRFRSQVKPDTIEIHYRDTVTVQANCPPVTQFKNKDASGLRALWQGYQLFAAWALLVLVFVLLFMGKIKKVFNSNTITIKKEVDEA